MNQNILKATHQGILEIGNKQIECANLEDGTRILSQKAVFKAFGRRPRGLRKGRELLVIKVPSFLDAKNLQSFISKDLIEKIKPIEYLRLDGRQMAGYDAEILPLVCDVYLAAREQDALTLRQMPLAAASEILVRSLSKVGIIALIDEATGYQDARARDALQQILEKFIAEELRPWRKTFQDEFYKQMFRLNNWPYTEESIKKRPGVIGTWTNDIIYDRLAPGVRIELQRIVRRDHEGRPLERFHQHLTENFGYRKLVELLNGVIALMKASASWRNFRRLLQRAFPKYGTTMELPLDFGDE